MNGQNADRADKGEVVLDLDNVISMYKITLGIAQRLIEETRVLEAALVNLGKQLADWLEKVKEQIPAIEKCIDGDDANE